MRYPLAPSRLSTWAAAISLAGLGACAPGLRPLPPASAPTRAPASAAPPAVVVVADTDLAYLQTRELLLPVAGVRARSLRSSFAAPRDGGARAHLAVDILAPRGTAVLAADDGRVWTVRSNSLGGLTVYTVDPSDRFVFYYAHLDRYRDGLADGMTLLKGDTIGFVGTTGNAPPDVPHLHFQVARIGPDRKWWTGTPIDPVPYLQDVEIALAGRAAAVPGLASAPRGDAAVGIVVPVIPTPGRRNATVPADTGRAANRPSPTGRIR